MKLDALLFPTHESNCAELVSNPEEDAILHGRDIMLHFANTVTDLCDGTTGAHDSVLMLRQQVERRMEERGIAISKSHREMLSAATELAQLGARILHVNIYCVPVVIQIDHKRLHFLARPELYMQYTAGCNIGGAEIEWHCPVLNYQLGNDKWLT